MEQALQLNERAHACAFGAVVLPDGSVRFQLWAPRHEQVWLCLQNHLKMLMQSQDGWHCLTTPHAAPGMRYKFAFADGSTVPDPASRFQPDDVDGPSEVIDAHGYAWRLSQWRITAWESTVLYELHIGTFTAAGTFLAAIDKLPHLVTLGVTALSIMPVADFPGRWNWGYDGAFLYAPDSTYGRPEHFKQFIDAAHAHGLMVLLDVVYNHFGPQGNYLGSYAPAFFSDQHTTPWGAAINYDGAHSEPVRAFMIHNALYWLEEFRLDGLRLDAVHAIIDDSSQHLINELAAAVHERIRDRPVYLLLENEKNQSRYLLAGPNSARAQWNDDVHHVLHTAATHECDSYYRDYQGDIHKLARALSEGFVYQGEWMAFKGEVRGEPSKTLPPAAFVAFIQNHDQIGNRRCGERLGHLVSAAPLRAVAATYLLLPQIPMLFMGEEWNAGSPFAFFCDYQGELGQAIRSARERECAAHVQSEERPTADPLALDTFVAAKLDWAELEQPEHADSLAWYRRILQCRTQHIAPLIAAIRQAGRFEVIGRVVLIRWQAGNAMLMLAANLSDQPARLPALAGEVIWIEGAINDGMAAAWTVCYMVSF